MQKSDIPSVVNWWALSGELGLIIALPLVAMVIIGVKLDRWLGTMPLFILLGMALAATISSIAVWRKIKRLS